MPSVVNQLADPVLLPATHPMHMVGTTSVGAALGFVAAGAAGAGPGALIGLAAGFVQYPTEKLIEHFTNPESMASESAAMVAHTINCIASNALVWGGAALLGVVSAPVALGIGGFAAVYGTVSKLEDFALRLSGCTWKLPVMAILTAAVKIGLIAAGAFALVFFGVVAPPVGIALGVAASLLAIVGTYYAEVKIAMAGLEESERNLKKAQEDYQQKSDAKLIEREDRVVIQRQAQATFLDKIHVAIQLLNESETLEQAQENYQEVIRESGQARDILIQLRDNANSDQEKADMQAILQKLDDSIANVKVTKQKLDQHLQPSERLA